MISWLCFCPLLHLIDFFFPPYTLKSVRPQSKKTSPSAACARRFWHPFKSLTFHVLFTVGVTGSGGLWALPCLWRRWTSLLCRTRRARWSALSSSVLSTSWSAQKTNNKKRREAAMTFRHRRGMSYYSKTGPFLAFWGPCVPHFVKLYWEELQTL